MKLKEKFSKALKTKRLVFVLGSLMFISIVALLPVVSNADLGVLPTTDYQNALSISFVPQQQVSPPQFQAGQTMGVNISLTNKSVDQSKNGFTLNVVACPMPTTATDYPSCTLKSGSVELPQQTGTGVNTSNISMLLPSTLKTGNYDLFFQMSYSNNQAVPNFWNYFGSVAVSMAAATQGANPALSVAPATGGKTADGAHVQEQFSISFTPASGGSFPDHYVYDCGNGSGGTASHNQLADNFYCTYATSTNSFTVSVTAYATGDNSQKMGLPATVKFAVTGNEAALGGAGTGTAPQDGGGGGLAGFIEEVIGFILGIFQEFIYVVFSFLIVPVSQALLSIRAYQDNFVAVIYPGWIIIRNLSDMVFIVALIVIGLATLFRIQSYQYKHLLVQLILAALLINFSLVIGQAVLGIADTVQAQFLPANESVISSLGANLMVTSWRKAFLTNAWQTIYNGSLANIVTPLFYFSLALGSFAVFCAIDVFLFIRIVALWILLMISPIAYACGVLPATAHYREEWWKQFLRYAFFTPVMAFFLSMAANMVNAAQSNLVLQQLNNGQFAAQTSNPGVVTFVFQVGSNILLLVFLLAGLMVAEQFSIYGAKGITDVAKKGIFAPFAAAGAGANAARGAIGRSYVKKMAELKEQAEENNQKGKARLFRGLEMLHPKVLSEAWKQRQHELEEEAFLPATGDARDTLNRIMPTEWHREHGKLKLGRKTGYGKIGREQIINIKLKEWSDIPASEEEKVQLEKDAIHIEDMVALNRMLIDGRHEDGREIYASLDRRKKKASELYKKYLTENLASGMSQDDAKTSAQTRAEQEAEKDIPAEYDAIRDLEKVYERMAHHGLGAHELGRIASRTDEYCEANKKLRQMGWGVYEEHEKAFRTANDFGGYKTLQDQQNRYALLGSLASTGMFDEPGQIVKKTIDLGNGQTTEVVDKLIFQLKDKSGNVTGTREIYDYAGLTQAVSSTKLESDVSGNNFGYELTGARMAGSAQKRMERGNFEDTIKALEPAALMVQNEHGKFIRFTARGKRTWARMPAMTAATLAQSRQAQARVLKMMGIYASEKAEEPVNVKPYNVSVPPTDPAYCSDGVMYDVMADTFSLNPSAASGVLKKAKLSEDQVKEIRDHLNAVLGTPEWVARHGRARTVDLEKDSTGVGLKWV